MYENGCPFPIKDIFRSEKGTGVLYGISVALIFITIIEALFIWKRHWKNIKIEKLKNATQVQFEDYILMMVLAMDFFQIISQGSGISELFFLISKACNYSLIKFTFSVDRDIYWDYLYYSLIISGYSFFVALILISRPSNCVILRYARSLAIILLPIIGNALFLPIVSIVLSIFQCDQGTGLKITDSFIRQDCTMNCWDNKYSIWGGLSIASLVTYIPLTIYFRYFYENFNGQINIKTQPIFILEKIIFQVIIAVLYRTLKIYDESLHGLCCIVLIFIMILLSFKQRPYNYSIMNFWLITSYFGILWSFALSSLYWFTKYKSWIMWISLQYSVLLILIVVGFLIQWKCLPSLLITEKSVDIAIFFRFSIGSQISASEINRMRKEIIENKTFINEEQSNIDSSQAIFQTSKKKI